ncbi:hypothetical protein Tco_0604876 [Tanacetum coccineum]
MIAYHLVPRTCHVRCQMAMWQAVIGQPPPRVRKRDPPDTSLLISAGQRSTPRGIHVLVACHHVASMCQPHITIWHPPCQPCGTMLETRKVSVTSKLYQVLAHSSSNSNTDKIMARMDAMTLKMDAQYKELQNHAKKTKPDEDDIPISQEEEAKFMQTFRKTRFYNDYATETSNNDNCAFQTNEQSTNAFVKETFMDLKTQLETVAKNHQASIQNLETKFDRLADKQSGRPSGSLPSNTQTKPKRHNSKAYQPPRSRNEHVNAVFTRSGKSYNPSVNPNDQQNDSETPINFDSDDEDEESTPQPVGNTKSVGHFQSPLVWPSNQLRMSNKAKENMLTYSAEAIQADCDIKAINIILQGLPTEIYALSVTRMPLEQFQVNTKFLNTLPDEWSKFVTDVKLVKDLHTTNVDQLHAHLQQHERHAIEVRLMHERNPDPLALVASHQLTQPAYQTHLHPHQQSLPQQHISPYQSSQFLTPYQHHQYSTPLSSTYPTNEYQSTVHHNVYSQQPSIPQLEYAPTTYQQQQPEFSQPDSSLVVPVFQKGDDPIDAINHMMSFLTAVVTSRDVQPEQVDTASYAAGTTRNTHWCKCSNSGKPRTLFVYKCQREGHIAKQCTKPKRKRDETWFNDKVLLVQAQAGGQALTEEEIAFLADPGLPDVQNSQSDTSHSCLSSR